MSVSEPAAYSIPEQVTYESSVRVRYAVLAFVAGILIVVSQLIQALGAHTNVVELTLDLITINKRFPIDVIGATVDALGLISLGAMLNWLAQISRVRNPGYQRWVRWLVLVGVALSALSAVAYQVAVAIQAHKFVTQGAQTYPQANNLTGGGWLVVFPLLAQLGSLLLAAGFIWVALNAMRVGLFTRLLGYTGVIAGALVLFPIGAIVPVVQAFWLVTAAVLFAGRLPSGDPPAWAQGIAVPWDPAQSSLGNNPRQPRGARGATADNRSQVVEGKLADDGEDTARTRANTPKRKRKKR